jgi:chromosome segregation ATPase
MSLNDTFAEELNTLREYLPDFAQRGRAALKALEAHECENNYCDGSCCEEELRDMRYDLRTAQDELETAQAERNEALDELETAQNERDKALEQIEQLLSQVADYEHTLREKPGTLPILIDWIEDGCRIPPAVMYDLNSLERQYADRIYKALNLG